MKKQFLFLLFLFLYTCTFIQKNKQSLDHLNGQDLSEVYCASCHLYAEPDLLPKSVWKKVLPEMGNRLGIISSENDPYKGLSIQENLSLKAAGIFPSTPLLTDSAWQKIVNFYNESAPDSLTQNTEKSLVKNSLFKASQHKIQGIRQAAITMVKIDERDQLLYVADRSGYLRSVGKDFKLKQSNYFSKPIIQLETQENNSELLLGSIGIMNPNDLRGGAILKANKDDFSKMETAIIEIPRLVNFVQADMNNDGFDDFVSCGFGHRLGNFSYYQNKGLSYEQQIIKNAAGALKTYPIDADADGDLDLITLFAHGDEGISLFINDAGTFTEKRLLSFQSVFGSRDFELIDIEQDGDLDIVYANGDNGDKSYTLKPYHGIRIFINDGDFQFEERYFFPMHGASKVKVSDYDQDGDFDIFATSFYPDFEKTENSLLYLENQNTEKLIFETQYIPAASTGRWITMDTGDLDNDGDEDVVIGSFLLEDNLIPNKLLEKWQQLDFQILFLENNLVSKK